MTVSSPRFAVLVSGRGSNLGAILRSHAQIGALPSLVVSHRRDAAALALATEAGVPAVAMPPMRGETREAYDARLEARLREADVTWVVLAGWMRILSEPFVRAWAPRLVNIHPSLLPSFPGLHPHAQALARGVQYSGCTVHRVEPGPVDGGEILAQSVVPVLPDDTESSLAERILRAEHALYPATIARLFSAERDGARYRQNPPPTTPELRGGAGT